MGRRTKTLLPTNGKLLKPKIIKNVYKNLNSEKVKEKEYIDKEKNHINTFNSGDNIMLREGKRQWVQAKIISPAPEPRSFIVKKPDGSVYRRNTWHMTPAPQQRVHHPLREVLPDLQDAGQTPAANNTKAFVSAQPPQDFSSVSNVPQTNDKTLAPTTPPSYDQPSTAIKTTRSGRQVIPPKRFCVASKER